MTAARRSLALLIAFACCAAEPQAAEEEQQPGRFTAQAQQFLETAKAKLEAKRQQELERQRLRAREEAQRDAIAAGERRLERQQAQEREAQRQLELARERQLKALYQQGLARYREGAYEDAVRLFQQMVLLDPTHALVKAADRLMAQAEMKHFEARLRASLESPQRHGAIVPDLEQALTQKRIELETAFKYAKEAIQDRKYDIAIKLLTAVLVQDPSNREAHRLIEQAQMARLDDEEYRARRQVTRDERAMYNEVLKAQLLPALRQAPLASGRQLLATDPERSVAAKLQAPISFEFNDVALSDVLDFIADAANVSVVPSPQLDLKTRRVSLKVKDLPLERAIKYLVKSLSLAYRVERDAVLISTQEEFSSEPMETRVFLLQSGLGPFALETAALERNPALAMESLTTLIEQAIPKVPDGKFIVDQRSGSLIVTNTAENLRLVERLLGQLDVTPLQVLIEARFVELTLTDLEHFGLESVLTGPVTLSKKEHQDGTQGVGNQLVSGGGFKFPALAREDEGVNLTLQGVLSGTQFETVLHLLEESKKTKTLSAPRVTTLNNQSAVIRVVDEFNYPTRYEVSLIQFDINGDGDFDDAGETEFANVPQDLQKRDVGILLNVTPSVGNDLKTITLVLAPEVSSFSQFRDLGGGVTVPEFTSSQLTTSVVIEDGQTVVLGGLMKDATSKTTTKVPVLGDLPLVGGLFRQTDESSTRKNLLIFITARLLAPRGETT